MRFFLGKREAVAGRGRERKDVPLMGVGDRNIAE
jgi:hypothetical protein